MNSFFVNIIELKKNKDERWEVGPFKGKRLARTAIFFVNRFVSHE